MEPRRRMSGGRCGRSRRQSCAARCRRRWRSCPHWCGQWCMAQCGARCTAKPTPATHGAPGRQAEALPAAGAAGQGERGEHCDEHGAQRRREEHTAVERPMPSMMTTTVADRQRRRAQRPKGAEARGIPARRAETAQRARQGSPVAKRRAQIHLTVRHTGQHLRRQRNDQHRQHRRQQHPRHHRPQRRHRRRRHRHDAGQHHRRLASGLRGRSGGAAAERGAAGDARSEGGWWSRCPTKKGDRAAGVATRPVVAMRLRRRRAGRGCRVRRPCRRGCR